MTEQEIRDALADIIRRLDRIEEKVGAKPIDGVQVILYMAAPVEPPIDLGGTYVYACPMDSWTPTISTTTTDGVTPTGKVRGRRGRR